MSRKEVTFYSDGGKIGGEIWFPEEHKQGEKRAACIFVMGWTANYELGGIIPDICYRLSRQGYIALTFDFRGFGKSKLDDGRRMVHPLMQATDLRNAITFLETIPDVDPNRIGIGGISTGASVAVCVAAVDQRVSATISLWGFGNGARHLKGRRGYPEWTKFLAEVEKDRRERVLTGKSAVVHHSFIVPVADEDRAFIAKGEELGNVGGQLLLQTVDEMMSFRPEDHAHLISKPILYVHPLRETLLDYEESIRMYQNTKAPKTLWLIPPEIVESHFNIYQGVGRFDEVKTTWQTVFSTVLTWVVTNLPNDALDTPREAGVPKLEIGYSSPLPPLTY